MVIMSADKLTTVAIGSLKWVPCSLVKKSYILTAFTLVLWPDSMSPEDFLLG